MKVHLTRFLSRLPAGYLKKNRKWLTFLNPSWQSLREPELERTVLMMTSKLNFKQGLLKEDLYWG